MTLVCFSLYVAMALVLYSLRPDVSICRIGQRVPDELLNRPMSRAGMKFGLNRRNIDKNGLGETDTAIYWIGGKFRYYLVLAVNDTIVIVKECN